jgi:hypothetical protein
MSDAPPAWSLAFLTEEWAWEADIDADGRDAAIALAREALEAVVREERPELACVKLLEGTRRIGVWDWVAGRAVWTPAR